LLSKRVLPEDHHCAWREEAEELRASLDTVQADVDRMRGELEALKRAVFGKKSEKMPPMSREAGRKPSREETQQKRAANAETKEKLVT
jgi:transposase